MSRYATPKSDSTSSGRKESSSYRSEDSTMMSSDVAPSFKKGGAKGFRAFQDRFDTLEEVSQAIREEGVEHCSLMFGIDYTMSNIMQGEKSFGGLSLHDLTQARANPYQQVICILGETLEPFNDDDTIPAFGFGDKTTKDKGIFPFKPDGECEDFCELLEVYNEVTPNIKLSGPTNFAPLIDKAVEIVKERKKFHVLVIVADGQVTSEQETIDSIVEASHYPLSIVLIGVGDGPWEVMKDFDQKLKQREFDNFRFVDFHNTGANSRNPQAAIACSALQLIPDQYNAIKENKILQRVQ